MNSANSKLLPKCYQGNRHGFTLIELLIVIAIIGILAVISTPHFMSYKTRAHDADAKANLHHIFTACKAYWVDTDPSQSCSLVIAKTSTYGYVQSVNVAIAISGALESNFAATAVHSLSSNSYSINSTGNVS